MAFTAQTSWYGPGCRGDGAGRAPGNDLACIDRAPQQKAGSIRLYPLRRVGCGGTSTEAIRHGPGGRKVVALTFDDGPSVYTPQVLQILNKYEVHATFFVIGEQVPTYAGYARAVLAQGSELANHTMHHDMGPGRGDLAETDRVIQDTTGFEPCMFRPPGGYLPNSTEDAARSLGMTSVLWDVDTRDYTLPGSATIASRATSVQPGSIVLMHDGGGPRDQTVEALPRIIKNLRHRGYRLVTMTQMLGGRYRLAEDHRPKRDPMDMGFVPGLPPPVFREGP